MDRYMDKANKISNAEPSEYINAHFQLFIIFEDSYNKILGEKIMLASSNLFLFSSITEK